MESTLEVSKVGLALKDRVWLTTSTLFPYAVKCFYMPCLAFKMKQVSHRDKRGHLVSSIRDERAAAFADPSAAFNGQGSAPLNGQGIPFQNKGAAVVVSGIGEGGAGNRGLEFARDRLQEYVLMCSQQTDGGLSDKPGKWDSFNGDIFCLAEERSTTCLVYLNLLRCRCVLCCADYQGGGSRLPFHGVCTELYFVLFVSHCALSSVLFIHSSSNPVMCGGMSR